MAFRIGQQFDTRAGGSVWAAFCGSGGDAFMGRLSFLNQNLLFWRLAFGADVILVGWGVVEFVFFGFGGTSYFSFYCMVGDDNEVPSLHVCAAWSRGGGQQAIFNDFSWDVAGGETADAAPSLHVRPETGGPVLHLVRRIFTVRIQFYEFVCRHAASIDLRRARGTLS